MNNDYEQIHLFKIGLKHYLGLQKNLEWRKFKKAWREYNHWPIHCSNCKKVTRVYKNDPGKNNTLTLDHIIPESMLELLEMYELMYDFDNYALLCYDCNMAKGCDMPPLSMLKPKLAAKFLQLLDDRNRKLALNR